MGRLKEDFATNRIKEAYINEDNSLHLILELTDGTLIELPSLNLHITSIGHEVIHYEQDPTSYWHYPVKREVVYIEVEDILKKTVKLPLNATINTKLEDVSAPCFYLLKRPVKDMTLEEIEKALGYPVRIVSNVSEDAANQSN